MYYKYFFPSSVHGKITLNLIILLVILSSSLIKVIDLYLKSSTEVKKKQKAFKDVFDIKNLY